MHYKLALEYFEDAFNDAPDKFRENLAHIYYFMVISYGNLQDVANYDIYHKKALKLYIQLYELHHERYKNDLIELQNRKVWRLLVNGKVDEAMVLAKETYALDESNGTSKEYLAECYNMTAYEYANASDYVNAYKSIEKAISMLPNEANFYDSKGEILLMQGKNTEALEIWNKVLEMNPNFLNDFPNGTNLSNGLKKLGLIE